MNKEIKEILERGAEIERLTEVIKYIKNLALTHQKQNHVLWQINNVASNALNLPYDEPAEFN